MGLNRIYTQLQKTFGQDPATKRLRQYEDIKTYRSEIEAKIEIKKDLEIAKEYEEQIADIHSKYLSANQGADSLSISIDDMKQLHSELRANSQSQKNGVSSIKSNIEGLKVELDTKNAEVSDAQKAYDEALKSGDESAIIRAETKLKIETQIKDSLEVRLEREEAHLAAEEEKLAQLTDEISENEVNISQSEQKFTQLNKDADNYAQQEKTLRQALKELQPTKMMATPNGLKPYQD